MRDLVARPVALGRVEPLSRFTAPTRSVWFWLTLWIALAVASFAALIPALFDREPPMAANDVLHSLSGTSFAACGLVAWRRRRDSAIGPMLTIAQKKTVAPQRFCRAVASTTSAAKGNKNHPS